MNDLPSIKETGTPVNIATPLPDGQTVTEVKHWTDKLFSFRLSRPQSLRFRSGEFVMIGLMGDPVGDKPAKPILRAYSIASPSWDEELEFYSIAVPDGPKRHMSWNASLIWPHVNWAWTRQNSDG